MKTKKIIFLMAMAWFVATRSFAASNPYQIEDSLDQTIRTGLHELYNLNFEKARAIFASIEDQSANHPVVALGVATIDWWEISVNVAENDPASSRPFLEAANRCVKISQTKIHSGDPTGEASLALGSVYALLARWEAANHHWMTVYHREKKATSYLKKTLKKNPGAMDAYMALGIFDYTLSTLPRAARLFSGSDLSGDASEGLRELQIAADQGIYLRLPAVFLLASIYSEDLKDPAKTVEILSKLRMEYPLSPFIDLMMFTALYNQGCNVEMSVEAEECAARVETGVYATEFKPQAEFMRALVHFKAREWAQAIQGFDRAVESASKKNAFRIWAMLYKGYALDALGDRDQALMNYRKVLSERPRWKSHDYAKERLRTPFEKDDPELTTLLL